MDGGTTQRAAESRAVHDLLTRARISPAGLVVEGDAGIGKSTLMFGAAAEAESRGFRVLSTQGSPAEVTFAYASVADLLREVDSETLTSLPELQRLALERAQIGDVDGAGPATDERTVAIALLSVIERCGTQGPVLLVIDDAQWLDASSRAAIGFAARRLTGPVGIVLSFRTGDPDSADERSWLQFRHPESLGRVNMQPLSHRALHVMIADRLGHTLPRPTMSRIYEISGGNPFFAIELALAAANDVAASKVELPDSLAALVRNRLGHADDAAAEILLAAACSAAPTVEMIARATGTSPSSVVGILEPMEHSRTVVIDGNRVRFAHPLFATGVYTEAASARRRAMHRDAGHHRRAAGDQGAPSGSVRHHRRRDNAVGTGRGRRCNHRAGSARGRGRIA